MAHKIVNLDDEANSVSITVAGKTFDIKRIVLKARQLYGEYLVMSGEYLRKVSDANNLEGKTVAELKAFNAELEKAVEEYAVKKAEILERLLQVILEKNGYEFNFQWWEENSDYSAIEQFIFTALKKDEKESDTKKKVTQ